MTIHAIPLTICIAGATGWIGRPLCSAIAQADDLRLAGASPYIHGTLLAIRKVCEHVGLIRGLDRVMD